MVDFAGQTLTCDELEGEFYKNITFLFLYLPGGLGNYSDWYPPSLDIKVL